MKIAIPQVDGLAAELSDRPEKDTNFDLAEIVRVNASGKLETFGYAETDLAGFAQNVTDLTNHIGSKGAAHADADTMTAGFMSAAHWNKVEGVESGATNNSADFAGSTWTPTFRVTSGAIASYSVQTGHYKRIGDIVILTFRIVGVTSATLGAILNGISGLPFNTSSSVYFSGDPVPIGDIVTNPASWASVKAFADANQSYLVTLNGDSYGNSVTVEYYGQLTYIR